MIEDVCALQRRVGATPDGKIGPATIAAINSALDRAGVAVAPKPSSRKMAHAAAFYAAVRVVTGPLDQVQVDTIARMLAAGAHWPVSWLAYGLATAWHEARLKPIEEIGKGRGKPYGVPGRNGRQIPYGRGLVQLTWDENYERADKELGLGVRLIKDYSLALDPDIAARILIGGMEKGWFAGDRTGRHTNARHMPAERATLAQFTTARRIINGTDRAAMIAGYALKFQNAVSAGGWA